MKDLESKGNNLETNNINSTSTNKNDSSMEKQHLLQDLIHEFKINDAISHSTLIPKQPNVAISYSYKKKIMKDDIKTRKKLKEIDKMLIEIYQEKHMRKRK